MKVNPRSILITGCSTGIGYHTAKTLHQRGHRVIASCRKTEDVERLAAEGLTCIQLNLNDSDSIAEAFQQTLQLCKGRLDALFNNGAFGLVGALEDVSREALKVQFETNVFGWLELTNHAIPVMRQQGFGRIIQNSSVLGFVALPYRGPYVASKYAIEGLSDTLRLELKGTGIDVSLVEPGPIESQFRENAEKAFLKLIDPQHSRHLENYRNMQKRLQIKGPAAPFTLPASAVVDKVIHALESPKPKARYYVTFPTFLFGYLKRILTTRGSDRMMLWVSGSGKR